MLAQWNLVMHQQSSKSKKQSNAGVVRIIGGEMRGRKLHFNTVDGLRPTLDRVRETLFNWLAKDIHGAHCLDLFAGSGALGFEAASRGATQVTMVEKDLNVSKNLLKNTELLKVNNRINIINSQSDQFLRHNTQKFNLIFLDPPFGLRLLKDTLLALKEHLTSDAIIYIEQESVPSEYTPSEDWLRLKYKNTNRFSYALYQLKNET